MTVYDDQVPQRSHRVLDVSDSFLREGVCFKALHLACTRSSSSIEVTAEEIVVVEDSGDEMTGSRTQVLTSRPANRSPFERRKLIIGSSFVVSSPGAHLVRRNRGNHTIIDVERGHLQPAKFEAMEFKPGVGYAEVNVAEVLLGLDPSAGNHWITPDAWAHICALRQRVSQAGGVFLADFDKSVGGWARVRYLYICPEATNTIAYIQVCKTMSTSWCKDSQVVLPLICDGGMMFTRRFSPSKYSLADPV